jgi:hypothetical protein
VQRVAVVLALGWIGVSEAQAQEAIDPACAEVAAGGTPEDYNEAAQQEFLANYPALYTSFSPVHGPVPHDPGHGSIGVELAIVPPLSCERRLVFDYNKTEDTNKTPLIPRPRVSFAFPAIGRMVPYAGVAYIPPIPLFGTTNVILSGEVGVGFQLGELFQIGGRFHATSQKTVGEIATPFEDGGTAFDDLYIASTFGLDLMTGLDIDPVTPYLAVGFMDASTFFYVGDDNMVVNNFHPYFGPTFSVGVDGLVKWIRFGGEFYAAPGGYSLPDDTVESVKPASRYGQLYTARFKIGVEL